MSKMLTSQRFSCDRQQLRNEAKFSFYISDISIKRTCAYNASSTLVQQLGKCELANTLLAFRIYRVYQQALLPRKKYQLQWVFIGKAETIQCFILQIQKLLFNKAVTKAH